MRAVKVIGISLVAMMALAVLAPAASAAKGPIANFNFKGNFKNSVKGSPVRAEGSEARGGTGSFQVVDVAGNMKQALVFTGGYGVKLRRIPKSVRKQFSMDIFFELDSIPGSAYRRVMSFGLNDIDEHAIYFWDTALILYDTGKEGSTSATADDWMHVLVTRSKQGRVKIYYDGVQEISYMDNGNDFWLKKGLSVLFQDESNPLEETGGTVSNVRIYDRVLVPS